MVGAVTGWLFLFQTKKFLGASAWEISWADLAGGSIVSLGLILSVAMALIVKGHQRQLLYRVEINFGGESVSLVALLDTGNRVYTYFWRYPVIIAEFNSLVAILSNYAREYFLTRPSENWLTELDSLGGPELSYQGQAGNCQRNMRK